MREEFIAYEFILEAKDRKKLENSVKVDFLKADSEGSILILKDM